MPESRFKIFSEIHEIVFHGNGGYAYWDVYSMPLWLRRFTYKKIEEHYKKQEEMQEQQMLTLNKNKSKHIDRPDIIPTYSTKSKGATK